MDYLGCDCEDAAGTLSGTRRRRHPGRLQNRPTGLLGFSGFSGLEAPNQAQLERRRAAQEAAAQRKAVHAAQVQQQRTARQNIQTAKKDARGSAAALKKEARIAKRLANGQTISAKASESALIDKINAQLAVEKARQQVLKARLAALKGRPPRQGRPMKGFFSGLLGLLGFGDFTDNTTNTTGTTPQDQFALIQQQQALAAQQDAVSKACKRPNAPKCLFAQLSFQTQQQMAMIMSILQTLLDQNAQLEQQIMELMQNGYGAGGGQIIGTNPDGSPIYGTPQGSPYYGPESASLTAGGYDPIGGGGGGSDPYGGSLVEFAPAVEFGTESGAGALEAGPDYFGAGGMEAGGGGPADGGDFGGGEFFAPSQSPAYIAPAMLVAPTDRSTVPLPPLEGERSGTLVRVPDGDQTTDESYDDSGELLDVQF